MSIWTLTEETKAPKKSRVVKAAEGISAQQPVPPGSGELQASAEGRHLIAGICVGTEVTFSLQSK